MASKTRHILIVGNDVDWIHDITKEFQSQGDHFEITVAKSVKEGLRICQERRADLILIGDALSGADDNRFLKKLRSRDSFTPIIIIFDQYDAKSVRRAMDSGATDYLCASENFFQTLVPRVMWNLERARSQPKTRHREATAPDRLIRMLIDHSSLNLAVFEKNGNCLDLNPGARSILNLDDKSRCVPGYNILSDPLFSGQGLTPKIKKAFTGKHTRLDAFYVPGAVAENGSVNGKREQRTCSATIIPVVFDDGTPERVVMIFDDCSSQQKVLRSLRESEAKYRSLIDNLLSGVFIIQNQKFVYVNDRYAEMFGYRTDEIIGKMGPLEVTAPSSRELVSQALLDRESGKVGRVDYFCEGLRKDGTTLICHILSSTIEHEGVLALHGTITDVTKQYQIKEQLRSSEEKYRTLFTNASYGFFQRTLEGQFITVNPAFAKLLGYNNPEELIGSNNIIDLYYHEFEIQRFLDAVQKSGKVNDFVSTLRRKDGTPVVIKENVQAIYDSNGKILYLEGIVLDITDQMQAEAEIKRLANFPQWNPNPTLELGNEGEILYYNPAMAKLLNEFGFEKDQIFELLPIELETICREMFDFGRTYDTIEYSFADRIFRWSLHAIPTEGVIHMYGFDITESKNLEKQLLQSQKMESIGTLAGGVAHDFNNLLMGIIGYTSLLLEDRSPDDPIYDDIQNIEKAAQRAAELTRQLLAFSRKAVGDVHFVNVGPLIRETVNLFSRAIKQKIQIGLNLSEKASLILIDPSQFQQVMMNLLVNAKDAMPDGGRITISSNEIVLGGDNPGQILDLQPGKYVVISVSDTGVGIPEENLERIFEPFFTTKEVGQGTGLGLSMVYGIVKSNDGHIEVRSEVGRGSHFSLYFKAAKDEYVTEVDLGSSLPHGKETILLVDDEEMILIIARRMLEKFGYQVLIARDGHDALEIYRQYPTLIDLVLLDLTMPTMDGRDLHRELKKINPEVRTILSSGFSQVDSMDELSELGIKKFVQKPYLMHQLLKVVRDVLDEA